ncbi:stevor PIR protein, putative [Plasmodium sp. gorilla clade G2]|uniref:stevor PIR protein, putative n=1 Tax=Plasmodium sp. gorilla clade G2 TaxID=880535 RepID=UPI000D20AE3F|nr:stevor PIR protein, putative [Plasmodium sp. gorilla clade G2]SOV11125.1 stevor PIR protein, putative [Plasmodium sp. gorilla clade G2]
MISYNFKLFIFSIVLGALTLFYNVKNKKNDCHGLYTNIKYKNIVLEQTNPRSLAESSHELTANDKHENNKLREYRNTKETKYKKNKYPEDVTKTKQKIPQITNKKFPGTPNLNKYRKKTYAKDKEANSNISPRSLKNLEMQRKLYNDFDGKQELYFRNISDQPKDAHESRTKKCLFCIFAGITYLLFCTIGIYKLCQIHKNNARKK